MAAFSQPIPLPTSVETVEVLAARSAVCLARDLNLGQVIFEGDAEVIIKAINSRGFSSSSFGQIIRDIKHLSSAFNKVSFSHTRRLGNRIAHGLSCMACNFSSFQVWMEDVPLDLSHVYFSELHEWIFFPPFFGVVSPKKKKEGIISITLISVGLNNKYPLGPFSKKNILLVPFVYS